MSSPLALVRWQDLLPNDRAAVLRLRLDERQVDFAGTIERAIENCEADGNDDVAGLAIRASEQIVGFLVLKRRSTAPKWAIPMAATVSAMRIDQDHQGKGFGSAALLVLPEWVSLHWPQCTSLTLSVDEENTAGIRAYRRAGFHDHGLRERGRIGWVRYMSNPAMSSL